MLMAARDDLDLDVVEQIIRADFRTLRVNGMPRSKSLRVRPDNIRRARRTLWYRCFDGVDVHDAFAPGRYSLATVQESCASSVGLSEQIVSRAAVSTLAPTGARSRRAAQSTGAQASASSAERCVSATRQSGFSTDDKTISTSSSWRKPKSNGEFAILMDQTAYPFLYQS
jgi:hypothetical protein